MRARGSLAALARQVAKLDALHADGLLPEEQARARA